MKLLKEIAICFDIEYISSINILNIFDGSDCSEVISLLKDVVADISKIFFFISEANDRGDDFGVVAFSYVCCSQNARATYT